jgi:sialate O-acetylesterase
MSINKLGIVLICLSVFIFSTINIAASEVNLKLPAIFGDNMVLQQGQENPVWGWADPGTYITVQLSNGKTLTPANTDKSGKWVVRLPKCKVGGPFILSISARKGKSKPENITFKNVMVGEVWLCSGQSNMEMPVASNWGKVNNYEQETSAATYPNIRFITVPHKVAFAPQSDFETKGWVECSPESVGTFSATAYFFGRNLYKDLNIPIGLIHSSWGGTRIEPWTSAEAMNQFPEYAKELRAMQSTPSDPKLAQQDYETRLANWKKEIVDKDPGFKDGVAVWANPDLDTKDWKPMQIPQLWEDAGLPNFDGSVWFRKEISLPESDAGKDLILYLGPIDDWDITWFNGTKIGNTDFYNIPRKYTIPGTLVKSGKNVIVVRALDTGGAGGFSGKPDQLQLVISNPAQEINPITLSGTWQYKVAYDLNSISPQPLDPIQPYYATTLYNGMIAPLVPYGIRGAIWYQGESNAGNAYKYRTLFPTMIKDWRTKWNQPEMPFLFVQLANYMAAKPEPTDDSWAELREAQLMTLSLPKTGMAVTIDIGNASDIHPKNKQEVGNRLALAARSIVYKEHLIYSGPIYQSYQIEGNKIRIAFKDIGKGIMTKDNEELKGFAIVGPDKKFYWAKAAIDGKTILVSSDKVSNPVAVRYAWAANPICNLYNQEGLPASPFRTDSWQGITEGK